MSWIKIHPEWFKSETKQLSEDFYYIEDKQVVNRHLVSCGNIVVRRKKTKKYPILIYYPKSTPLSPPRMFLLKNLLSQAELEHVSNLDDDFGRSVLIDYLSEKVKFYYLRHQNEDGSICIVESENLYRDSPQIFCIKDIIKRVHDWLISIETGHISADNIEVELFSHFKNKAEKLYFLLPDIFYDDRFVKGDCFVSKSPYLSDTIRLTYFGIYIVGENNAGISEFPLICSTQNNFFTPTPNIIDLITNQNIEKEINEKSLIRIHWWAINIEPKPFKSSVDLATLIGNGNVENGYNKIYSKIGKLLTIDDNIFIGIRFQNRKNENEWCIFKLTKKEATGARISLRENEIEEALECYSIEIIRVENFSDKTHHLRNRGRTNRDLLKNQSVSIIGCGALGSEISDIIGKAGVNKLTLIDYQLMKAQNAVRHQLGIDKTGELKVLGLLKNIYLHNPFINIQPLWIDVMSSKLIQYMDTGGIGISSIADDNIESYINQQAVFNKITIFYARLLRGGKCARIIRVIPTIDPCLYCLSLYLKEDDSVYIEIKEDPTLPTIVNECNNPIRPASSADFKCVAGISAKIILDHLQSIACENNHWIYFSEELPNLEFNDSYPYKVFADKLEIHPRCPLCNPQREKLKVIVANRSYKLMVNEARKAIDIETGGILIGQQEKNTIYIKHATEPGPNAIKEAFRFLRDKEYCQRIIDDEFKKYGNDSKYIGEWHYHPVGTNKPSNIDLGSLKEISESNNYFTDEPIMLIISKDLELSCTVHPINNPYYFAEYEIEA